MCVWCIHIVTHTSTQTYYWSSLKKIFPKRFLTCRLNTFQARKYKSSTISKSHRSLVQSIAINKQTMHMPNNLVGVKSFQADEVEVFAQE